MNDLIKYTNRSQKILLEIIRLRTLQLRINRLQRTTSNESHSKTRVIQKINKNKCKTLANCKRFHAILRVYDKVLLNI